ncbi:hypothetical protein N9D31_02240, partial [Oligoflexaceae bacterium]|nr:hypothetical protein [Oligoflexaceae bacterium]
SKDTDTPSALRGLWWMDGNPAPDEVLSFAGTKFIETVGSDGETRHIGIQHTYDEGICSWHDSVWGRTTHRLHVNHKIDLKFDFNEDYSEGVATTIINFFNGSATIEIPSSWLLEYKFQRLNAEEYSRDSRAGGMKHHYRFRKIVDENGKRLPSYDDYLESVKKRKIEYQFVPNCLHKPKNSTLPTVCTK